MTLLRPIHSLADVQDYDKCQLLWMENSNQEKYSRLVGPWILKTNNLLSSIVYFLFFPKRLTEFFQLRSELSMCRNNVLGFFNSWSWKPPLQIFQKKNPHKFLLDRKQTMFSLIITNPTLYIFQVILFITSASPSANPKLSALAPEWLCFLPWENFKKLSWNGLAMLVHDINFVVEYQMKSLRVVINQ